MIQNEKPRARIPDFAMDAKLLHKLAAGLIIALSAIFPLGFSITFIGTTYLTVGRSFVASAEAFGTDTPEQTQQYKYAMGLIQRQLYSEAAVVLSRVFSDPTPFSNRDGVIFWLAECKFRLGEFTQAAGLFEKLLGEFSQSRHKERAAYNLGWTHIRDNNPKSAIEAFARVTKQDMGLWIDAQLKTGFLMVSYSIDPDNAVSVYENLLKVRELTPTQRYEANLQAGIGLFGKAMYETAVERLNEALTLAPEEEKQSISFYIAESLFRADHIEEAMDWFKKVIAMNPVSELADKSTYSLAWCHIKTGSPAKAEPLFMRVAQKPASPIFREAVKNLIELQMNMHKYEEAIEWLSRAAAVLGGEEAVEMSYLRALALSRIGEFTKSLGEFKKFQKDNPNHPKVPEARYQCALIRIALGGFREALEELEPLLRRETDPQLREKAIYRTGECHYNLGNFHAAKESFERVIKEYPEGVSRLDALYQLGEIAYQSGSHADALEAFDTIGQTQSDLAPQAAFRAGEVLMKAGRFADAVAAFERYVQNFPQGLLKEDALFKIGLSQLELKDQAKALAAFSQLRESTGYFRQEARFQIGEISTGLGNYPLAIQQYKAILAEDPKNPLASRVRRALGICYFHLGEFDVAMSTFKDILKEYPATDAAIPESRFWLGRTLIAVGQIEEGILELLKVPVLYQKSPYIADAYAHTARAYTALGRNDKAKQMWREVLKLSPKQGLAQEAKKALE